MPSTTYTSAAAIQGRRFTCKRCLRVYPYPKDQGAPVRCECGWWYTNRGGRIREEFRPRIGGARSTEPEQAAAPAPAHH